MKKNALITFALAGMLLSTLAVLADFPHSESRQSSCSNLQIVNVCNLTENDLGEILQGHCSNIAVEFSAQTSMPINFFLKGDLLNLVDNEENFGNLEIQQTLYVRCLQEGLFFSTNLTDWKPLVEFITGHISVALSVQDGKPSISVGTEANCRS